ncbi:MAG TPA: sigma-70 family RNA polymerase sigma factor [bacterium]|jgi:RNA polymerase sigma factor (sigma-70 family)
MDSPEFTSESELFESLIRGDSAAWRHFIDRIAPVIRALAAKSNMSGDDVDDLSQKVVVRLIDGNCRALRKFDPARGSLHAWVKVIATRILLDQKRHTETRRILHEDLYNEFMVDPGHEFDDDIATKLLIDNIRSRLQPDERVAFDFIQAGVKPSEFARILGISVDAANQRVRRLKDRIRSMVDKSVLM